jgi:carboxylesterase
MSREDPTLDGRGYTFQRGRTGALLLHGLGGTPVEMRFLALALARTGITVSCPQLAGHTGGGVELKASTWQDWLASAANALDDLRRRCDTVIIGGLSMGAVLALMLAAERRDDVDGVACYSPTLRLDGWGIPWYARLFNLVPHKAISRSASPTASRTRACARWWRWRSRAAMPPRPAC